MPTATACSPAGLGLHYGAEELGVMVTPISGGQTQRQIMLIRDFEPTGLSCTPSYALNLAETAEDLKVDLRKLPLRVGIFGAEPWTEEMRYELESRLGIDAIDIYGLSEVIGPGVGIECIEAKNGLHVFEDHFLIEAVDVDTGEPIPYGESGEIVITSLTKEAFPVIRYRTRDISILNPAPCRCGRTHVRMKRVTGPHRRHADHSRRQRLPLAGRSDSDADGNAVAVLPTGNLPRR